MTPNPVPAWSAQAQSIKLGTYEHFKGNRYKVLGIGRHTETLSELVIYQKLYDDYATWVRPVAMFLETVKKDGQLVPRFKYLASEADFR